MAQRLNQVLPPKRRPDLADEIHAWSHEGCVGCAYHHNGDRRDECECSVPELDECPVMADRMALETP